MKTEFFFLDVFNLVFFSAKQFGLDFALKVRFKSNPLIVFKYNMKYLNLINNYSC